ncbi:aldose 1-epimerase family protein [Actinomyces radicidentis]|uniref:aldose 1-epimerase family protein n=1 Tax=Actinomyces radicidentis TaxID=111015 RepID=UPI0028EE30DC|nr:aldose 1-epimerase family protein [Actinomyces radicidentis]
MINGELIDLRAGDYEARVATAGATLVHLRRAGRDLVVPFDAEASLPCGWQGRTLVPWPNRIKGSRYSYGGEEYLVPCNEPETGSALHGLVGWSDFQVASDTSSEDAADGDVGEPLSEVTLELSLPASYGYPWALEVSVRYALDEVTGLTVTITSTNVGAALAAPHVPGVPEADGEQLPAPYGVSAHPYLTRSVPADECVLTVPASTVLDADPQTMAPAGLRGIAGTEWDWREGRAVGETSTDNAYTDLPDGLWEVRLSGGEPGTVVMTADAPWVQVYTAEHLFRRGVAVEPMTCPPNAFNTGDGLVTLEVGQTHSFRYSLREDR